MGECIREQVGRQAQSGKRRYFEYPVAHQVPIKPCGEVMVKRVEVWEKNKEGRCVYHNSWVTDFEVRRENVAQLMGIGRSRSRVENEQFNVHKKDGYEAGTQLTDGAAKALDGLLPARRRLAFLAPVAGGAAIDSVQKCREGESRRGLWTILRVGFSSRRGGELGRIVTVAFEPAPPIVLQSGNAPVRGERDGGGSGPAY